MAWSIKNVTLERREEFCVRKTRTNFANKRGRVKNQFLRFVICGRCLNTQAKGDQMLIMCRNTILKSNPEGKNIIAIHSLFMDFWDNFQECLQMF